MTRPRLRRVVVKVGSGLIADPIAGPDRARIEPLAAEIAAVMAGGVEVALVTSGAIAAGTARLGLGGRPRSIPTSRAGLHTLRCELVRFAHTFPFVNGLRRTPSQCSNWRRRIWNAFEYTHVRSVATDTRYEPFIDTHDIGKGSAHRAGGENDGYTKRK